jgi:hypothetical protein
MPMLMNKRREIKRRVIEFILLKRETGLTTNKNKKVFQFFHLSE